MIFADQLSSILDKLFTKLYFAGSNSITFSSKLRRRDSVGGVGGVARLWGVNFGQQPSYPSSNGLSQADRDYFRMVRTENGRSDLIVHRRRTSEAPDLLRRRGGGHGGKAQLGEVQINQSGQEQHRGGEEAEAANESHSQLTAKAASEEREETTSERTATTMTAAEVS